MKIKVFLLQTAALILMPAFLPLLKVSQCNQTRLANQGPLKRGARFIKCSLTRAAQIAMYLTTTCPAGQAQVTAKPACMV